MGSGGYSSDSRQARAQSSGYHTKSKEQIFKQRRIHPEMSPLNLKIRESRDSAEHPESIAIIIALDETGSMGTIPHDFIKDGLPTIMQTIIDAGIPDPQVLFLGVGDHFQDSYPIQVGQFESSDELLDYWLEKIYLEGGGGGNGGESYSLAHYVAAHHTSIDCFEKRGQKGFLFTIGDEHNHPNYHASAMKNLFNMPEAKHYTSEELIKAAQEKYHVFHIDLSGGLSSWKKLLGERSISEGNYHNIPKIIANTIVSLQKNNPVAKVEESIHSVAEVEEESSSDEKIIL